MEAYSIICADDDEQARELYVKLFTLRGYDVRTCVDGSEVIPEFERQIADLFILDVDMPKKNGLQLCRELRRHPQANQVPIIVCSAYESEEVMVKALNAGADDYIIKPTKVAELYAKVAKVLKNNPKMNRGEKGLKIGNTFAGKYRIMTRLGTGGFSQVYKAEDVSATPPKLTALKIFSFHQHECGPDYMAMFLREAYGLSKLDHPNIIRFYGFGENNSQYYLAMEYAEGQSIRQILDERGPIQEKKVAMLAFHVLQALKYLKKFQIVHRDITPHNILILDSGDVKLIDFGLAKPVKDGTLTPEGMFAGSPLYAAPEIIMDSTPDVAADIFSLGATMYTMITNTHPFPGNTPWEIFQNRFEAKPQPVIQANPNVSVSISLLIEQMMAYEKVLRPSLDAIEKSLLKLC